MNATKPKTLLVVGAGISGISTALEAAEAGSEVVLVEREPSVGGRVLRSYHYFPKLCPPSCGMEINTRRLERNPRVQVLTQAHITRATPSGDGWSVTVTQSPAYVNDRCTACGACSEVCPATVPDPFNLGMGQVPAIRLPHLDAWPHRFVLNREACPDDCQKCVATCKYSAIDLKATKTEKTFSVDAIILATGWKPYPLEKLPELGGGELPDVIANVHMERLCAPSGPTQGQILRPSDGKPPQSIAFVQCAGSRDVNHLPYCSAVCCLASLKQALYVREKLPDSTVTIYYIDRRTPGRNEDMLTKVAAMEGVKLVKGKVGKVTSNGDGTYQLRVEDVEAGRIIETQTDLVVLATGMMPNLAGDGLPFAVRKDDDGFVLDDMENRVFVVGVARRPEDVAACVRDATGAAAKAIVASERGA